MASAPCIVGGAVRVVDTGNLAIDEYAGNVATQEDRISVAHVKIAAAASEPWLTLHYDEWICVLKGRMVLLHDDGRGSLEARAGQTVFIAKGTRFRPTFPDGDTEYVPVCLPAFRPDRCIREEEAGGAVSAKLAELHTPSRKRAKTDEEQDEAAPEILYHMCQRDLWEAAKRDGAAYFPPTFEADGGFTHATAVPSRLLDTANHFYQDVPGEWLCLRLRRSALRRLGIATRDERALPVGEKAVSEAWDGWVCPHIVGGLPPQAVDLELPMLREGGRFTGISGLTEMPGRVFKLATGGEAKAFREGGMVLSELDRKDGFVHLSDRSAAPKVASLFFKGCADLQLLELDPKLLPGRPTWAVGPMDDPAPTPAGGLSTVHYLLPEGCVHVYGEQGVPMGAVVRQEHLPVGDDGAHVFPAWL